MGYIYRMSRGMYQKVLADAEDCKMTIKQYVEETFGLLGKCVKVEIV